MVSYEIASPPSAKSSSIAQALKVKRWQSQTARWITSGWNRSPE
jgi:hypothetical protein